MKDFFGEDLLLSSDSARSIYREIKDLPIIDYHCHLNQYMIKDDATFDDIGELWLSGDHYKWRAMRLNGIDEYYITGKASYKEKFLKFASIMPNLVGGPLYYFSHLELKQVFGINEPLNEASALRIYEKANKKIKDLSVSKLMKLFKVQFVATTDDPIDDLKAHGTYNDVEVTPSFRPDKLYDFNDEYLAKLEDVCAIKIKTLDDLKNCLKMRLDYFKAHNSHVSDHGFSDFPSEYPSDEKANELFLKRKFLTKEEKSALLGNLLVFLMKEYKKRNFIVQIHFNVLRNVNSLAKANIGIDSGFDIIGERMNLNNLVKFLDSIKDEERPLIILYTLNPTSIAEVACASGAFRNVLVGPAWWFNDTLNGIKDNLTKISEYASLGNNTGMLTDSRSFSSYSRFDFYRRILSSFLGEKVDNGEYNLDDAIKVAENISYFNIKKYLGI